MGEGFIVRKGDSGKQALAPTITEISKSSGTITFTLTNNNEESSLVKYIVNSVENLIELNGNETSPNIVATELSPNTTFTIAATANGSETSEIEVQTNTATTYISATGGTTQEYNSGGKRYRSHTFLSSGTLTVLDVGESNDNRNKVDYLIIAGGGAGGGRGAGGGGAGGYRSSITPFAGPALGNNVIENKYIITSKKYLATVGAGGASSQIPIQTNNGSNSLFDTLVSIGGGGGSGVQANSSNFSYASSGGSGGGDAKTFNVSGKVLIAGGNYKGQGFKGGEATGINNAGAGGGGAGGIGNNSTGGGGGAGGAGLSNTLRTGSAETRAGGGGGAHTSSHGAGGIGGGGAGRTGSGIIGFSGSVNTGSGGGGQNGGLGGAGGSGIVVIRYEIAPV